MSKFTPTKTGKGTSIYQCYDRDRVVQIMDHIHLSKRSWSVTIRDLHTNNVLFQESDIRLLSQAKELALKKLRVAMERLTE